MSTAEITKRITEASPRVRSRFIGIYYLLTIVTGVFVLFFHGRLAFAADLVVGILYLAVTAFLYGVTASANKSKGH
jgi:hypothetical protein